MKHGYNRNSKVGIQITEYWETKWNKEYTIEPCTYSDRVYDKGNILYGDRLV